VVELRAGWDGVGKWEPFSESVRGQGDFFLRRRMYMLQGVMGMGRGFFFSSSGKSLGQGGLWVFFSSWEVDLGEAGRGITGPFFLSD